jgi:hypothetical protein
LHLELTPAPGATSAAHASVSINSLGPIDNLQIAATGLEPVKKYRVLLVGGAEPQELVTFSAGIGGSLELTSDEVAEIEDRVVREAA